MARVTVEDCIVQIPNRFELVLLAQERYLFIQVQIADQLLSTPDLWAIAYQDEPSSNELLDPRKHANDVVRSFYRPEVRRMHEDLLSVWRQGLGRTHIATQRRAGGIDEVVDDSNLALDVKLFDGASF